MARMHWLAGVGVTMCCSATQVASAQVTFGTGLRAASVDATGDERWQANQVAASALRLERPWLTLGSDGAVMRDGRGLWRTTGSLEAALFGGAPFGSRLAFVGSAGEPARDSALHPSRLVVGTRLSRRVGGGGAWIGADLTPSRADAGHSADLTSGLWRQFRSALISVSVSSRAGASRGPLMPLGPSFGPDSIFVDSAGVPIKRPSQAGSQDSASALVARRWSEAEGRLYWGSGRWSLDLTVGGRLAAAGVGAATWATADGAVLISPRLAIVGGLGKTPGGLASRLPAHRYASLGIRLMRSAPVARALPPELQPAAVGFEVQQLEPGHYRVALRVPRARVVELTGDFTSWQPVTLQRANGDWWEITLPITPGTHQVNVRINGERWIAPPGATVVDDDFAGVVGVIVVR
jgi:hypothetical protein